MARRSNFRIPLVGKLNLKSPNTWLLAGGVALAGLYFLASTGRSTGVQFIDRAADEFEGLYEDYVGPLGPAAAAAAPPRMQTAPIVPSSPSRGMSFDDMVFSGAYAADSALPYNDWWTNDISEDDRIIIA
jgi:hypothetical protein